MKEQQLITNIKRNRFWLWTALELYLLAGYFIVRNQFFEYPPPNRDIINILDDPPLLMILVAVATFVVVKSVWGFKHFHADTLMNGLVMFVLFVYFLAFVIRDYDLATVSLGSLYTGAVLGRVITEVLVRQI